MAYFKMSVWSDSLRYQNELNVYIPDSIDYDTPCDVILGLHGLCGNHTDFEKYNIEKYAEEFGFILVFPSSHNSYYLNNKLGENFLNFCGDEVFKILTQTYKIQIKNKGVIGISMGGYGALLVGLTYKFDFIANLSGSVNIDSRLENTNDNRFYNLFDEITDDIRIEKLLKSYQPSKLFSYCGTNDFLYNDNKKLNESIEEYCENYLIKEDDGDHSFDCWNNQFNNIFNYYKGEL